MNTDLLLHVDSDDPAVLKLALTNAINYANALPDEKPRMTLVANGPAVRLFTRQYPDLAARGEEAAGLGLDIRLCANALRSNDISPDALWPACRVIPAGMVELVRLQREGYAYVKP
ncbi:MAG: DsrE family protein [Desulfovibrionaceae bacterium]|nr:DsrE family protein [Desulfovibrionaceae bacterium]